MNKHARYDLKLKKRGSFVIDIFMEKFPSCEGTGELGRPQVYHDSLIIGILSAGFIFNLPYRQTIGFIESLLRFGKLKLALPHYTLLSKRDIVFDSTKISSKRLLIDSTGLSLSRKGTWCEDKHGGVSTGKKKYVKASFVVNSETLAIEAYEILPSTAHDILHFKEVIKVAPVGATIIGDGAYDAFASHETRPDVRVIAPPKTGSRIRWKRGYHHPRNLAVAAVQQTSMEEWKRRIGYHERSRIEAVNHSFKSMFSENLQSRTPANNRRELGIKVGLYNRFVAIGSAI